MPLPPETWLQGRYRIDRVLGRGGMGCVYLATDEQLAQKQVAIKEMKMFVDPSEREQAVRQFRREAQLLGSLQHDGLVDVTHYFEEGDHQYLVMAYLRGVSLGEMVKRTQGFLDIPTVLDWCEQMASVLEYLHGHQPPVIFRDLKPSNVMLDPRGHIRLIDFGIARAHDGKQTTTFIRGSGTSGYAPPEQYFDTSDPRTDLYSLGATMYHLVTSLTPPASVDIAASVDDLRPPSQVNSAVSPDLERLILSLMALRREERCPSAARALAGIRLLRTHYGLATSPARPPPPPLMQAGPTRNMGSEESSWSRRLKIGTVLAGRWVIDKPLGGGGMGKVYLGHLATLESKKVAIKVMRTSHELAEDKQRAMARFEHEANVLAGLDHPNLTPIHDFFNLAGTAVLVMKYVEGVTLQQVLTKSDSFLPQSQVLHLMRQLCDVLDYLHGHGVIFRDLKPANLMVGTGGKLTAIDFGIAQVMGQSSQAMTQSFLNGTGTHGYAPLELYAQGGKAGVATDIYSLGATLFAMLTRTAPPPSVTLVTGEAVLPAISSFRHDVSPGFERVIRDMMQMAIEDRLQTVAEVRRRLEALEAPVQAASPRPVVNLAQRTVTQCPRCHQEIKPSQESCPHCGFALRKVVALQPTFQRERERERERPPARPSAGLLAPDEQNAALAEHRALPAALRPEPLQVEAWVCEGLLARFKEKPGEDLRVLAVDGETLEFVATQRYKGKLTVRLAVPLVASGVRLPIDVKVSLEAAQAVDGGCRYRGRLKDLPPRTVALLNGMQGQERRRGRRFPVGIKVLSRDLPAGTLTVDVGPDGVGFISKLPLRVGTTTELVLDLADDATNAGTQARVAATVVHATLRPDGGMRVGAAFGPLSERSAGALLQFLKACSREGSR